MAKYILPTILTAVSLSLLSGCVTQSFENNQPIVKNQANRDEMAATRVSLGLGYLKMGDMSQAKLNLEKAKNFSPELVQVHTAFAHYYETVGESEFAINSFEKALSIKADSADTLNNYGVFLCRQDKVAAAEVQFLKAIAVPSYLLVSQSYENLASCYLQSDDFDKAEMCLHKSIAHDPNRTSTLLQMVRLQYAMANYKEAKRFLQKFERNTQRFTADSLSIAYKLYWKLGQRRTASNYANMLVKMYPQSWEGKQYLLNELEFINVDNLAKKYQLTQKEKNRHLSPVSNKRVVKLSPRKTGNSPYTTSVKTASTTKNSNEFTKAGTVEIVPAVLTNTSVVVATPAVAAMPIVTTAPQLATSATQSVLGSGTALLSATVAVTVAITSMSASNTPKTPIAKAEGVAPVIVAQVSKETTIAAESVSSEIESTLNEPTSTKPVAATRDVPLPEAIPEPVVAEVIAVETVTVDKNIGEQTNVATPIAAVLTAEGVAGDSESVDITEALHTVTAGENLYNISVKYNVKLKALRTWNDISEKNKIRVGEKLYVVDPQTVKDIND